LLADGHEAVVLSRRPSIAPWRVVHWDAETLGPWTAELEDADVVVNLAGRSVNCRYNQTNRQTHHGLARQFDSRRRRGDRAVVESTETYGFR
jgi:NAD dependent epimerase/dehydratase family enzyme